MHIIEKSPRTKSPRTHLQPNKMGFSNCFLGNATPYLEPCCVVSEVVLGDSREGFWEDGVCSGLGALRTQGQLDDQPSSFLSRK